MESSNPVFKRGYAAMPGSAARTTSSDTIFDPVTNTQIDAMEQQYAAPAAGTNSTGRMTMEDVVIKTAGLFAVLVLVGAFAWRSNFGGAVLIIGFIGAFIIGLVNTFARQVRAPLAIAYAAFEGLALGVLSHIYNSVYPGIVAQAVIGTVVAFAGVLLLYTNGKVRMTPQFSRALMGAMVGYLILGLVSAVMAMFGVGRGYGLYGVQGIGLLLCVGGVALASFFLIADFDQVEQMIKRGAPHQEAWRAGFGLMVTVVWLYLEIIRLLAILRDRN